jgi:hypothetical protein
VKVEDKLAIRRFLGNAIGCMSVTCSPMALWGMVALRFTPKLFDLPLNGWMAIWGVGLLLAFAAALLGSWKWVFAALAAVIEFFATMTLIFWYFG